MTTASPPSETASLNASDQITLSETDRSRLYTYIHTGRTSARVRTRFAEGGVDAVLSERRQTRYRQALTGSQQAHLIAIACSPVPDGHDHWTLRLLGRKAVELGFVEKISPETIRAVLKKTN